MNIHKLIERFVLDIIITVLLSLSLLWQKKINCQMIIVVRIVFRFSVTPVSKEMNRWKWIRPQGKT